MYIAPIHPRPDEPPLRRTAKGALRALLHLPVRLRMALDPDYPWLVAGAVRFLEGFLTPQMRVFEWGSGRSTVFFARRTASVVSVEHKAKWQRRVAARLVELTIANADLRLVPPAGPDIPPSPSPLRPARWTKQGIVSAKPEFTAYADAILAFPDDAFDLVSIDGRARVDCAANALDKLRPGGVLLLDNSEWPKYAPIFAMTEGWARQAWANGVWETTVLRKPVP
ncbi:hypothetical protein dsx2_0757 [Desulfovibrio sp. X2]|uniref:class I SAM-dependent methyltransferase n=1 Tax=Desulfovibrio sp. X2 TaxID=941449 RepID=UPI000358C5CB|nr:class I SAM-dependent methyltransferase [Desulfovibrio sp. X2]EPR37411.1 hypothetical protein dsx2_0757 [Desulfovibrio sp. X2]